MTESEVLKQEITYSEMKIQHICVNWFRKTYPEVGNLLFAIPNGGERSKQSGAMRKYEGAIAGVADLIFLRPSGGKATLCIEMKKPKAKGQSAGKQSQAQTDWQKLIERNGSVYIVCHGLVEFIRGILTYLHQPDIDERIAQALNLYPTYL